MDSARETTSFHRSPTGWPHGAAVLRHGAAVWSVALASALASTALLPRVAHAADGDAWQLAGRQGIIRMVIVPTAAIGDRAAHDRQIASLCAGQETCFVNFFSSSTGAPATLPLPDAIANEPVAVLRRSAKQGVDSFRWSCRLKRPDTDCF